MQKRLKTIGMESKKDIVSEHFELQEKRDKSMEMPINSLKIDYIKSLGKSELEKKLQKKFEGFTLMEFLNHTVKKIPNS
jgi:hypothetical protein